MTFSIAARDAATDQFGIAVSSSSPAVAARCAHLRPGVGAVCSQNVTDPRLGAAVLDRMERGAAAADALARVVAAPRGRPGRRGVGTRSVLARMAPY